VALIIVGIFNSNDSWVQIAIKNNILILNKDWLEKVHQSSINLEQDCAKFFEPNFLRQHQIRVSAFFDNTQNFAFNQPVAEIVPNQRVNHVEDPFQYVTRRKPMVLGTRRNNTVVSNFRPSKTASNSQLTILSACDNPVNLNAIPSRTVSNSQRTILSARNNPVDLNARTVSDSQRTILSTNNVSQIRNVANVNSELSISSPRVLSSRKRSSIGSSGYRNSASTSSRRTRTTGASVRESSPEYVSQGPVMMNQSTATDGTAHHAVIWDDKLEKTSQTVAANTLAPMQEGLSQFVNKSTSNQEEDIFMDEEERILLAQLARR